VAGPREAESWRQGGPEAGLEGIGRQSPRAVSAVPAISPEEKLDYQDEGGRECHHGQTMERTAVSAAAQQAEVAEPRVGAFNRPALTHGKELSSFGLVLLALQSYDHIGEAVPGTHAAHYLVVVATIEMEGVNVSKEAALGYGV